MSSQMEKIMQIYNQDAKPKPKIMEINKSHPLILNLADIYEKDVNDPVLIKAVNNLFNSVLLIDGTIHDPHQMASGIQDTVAEMVNLYLHEEDTPQEEEKEEK